jgi:hypothetical protein
MKRLMMLVGMTAAMVAGFSFAQETQTAPAAQGPRIICDEPLFDFGTADSQSTIEHTFVIRNIGDTTLEISQVRPACGCTLANISEKMVAPGAESQITARLSLQGRNGPQSKAITIMSNDPQNPEYRVTLAGTVATSINVTPDRLMFGQISPDQTIELVVEISGLVPEPFTLTTIEPSLPNLVAEQEVVQEGKQYRIKTRLTGPAQPGPLNASLLVRTDHPSRPVINIPVIANVVGELIYAPSVIELPASAGNQPVTRYIVLRPGALTQFELKAVKLPDPAMRSSIFPFGDQGYRIQIENIIPTAELNGKTIVLETSGEKMATIEIPLSVK